MLNDLNEVESRYSAIACQECQDRAIPSVANLLGIVFLLGNALPLMPRRQTSNCRGAELCPCTKLFLVYVPCYR